MSKVIPHISTSMYTKNEANTRAILSRASISCESMTFTGSNDDCHTYKLVTLHNVDYSKVTDKAMEEAKGSYAHTPDIFKLVNHIICKHRDSNRH